MVLEERAGEGVPFDQRGERHPGGRPPRATREAVVDAALELLRTDGLAAVTLAAVGQRLGLGKVAMYTYVASKEDLLLAMRDEVNRRQLVAVRGERELAPEAALKAMCLRLAEIMNNYGQLMAVVEPDLTGPGLEVGEHFLEALGQLGLEPAQQLQVWVLLAGFLASFAGRGEGGLHTEPDVERALAKDEARFPRMSGLLHEAVPAAGPAFVDDVLTTIVDVLIPALRGR